MDVTKSNLKDLLPEIKDSIDNAAFLAVDCEFSGLNSNEKVSCFDTHRTYYDKVRRGSCNYIVIQFGLCAFRFDEDEEVFKQRCYNFYVFPRQADRGVPDRRFSCQASSIDFLIGNNFDFNKLFREGITYLNREEENKCLEALLERQKQREKSLEKKDKNVASLSIPNDDREFIENNLALIDEYLKSDEKELKLPKCNAFLRKLMYQSVQERYGEDVVLETRIMENKDRFLFVTRMTADEKVAKEKKRCEQELIDLKDNVGVSTVVQYISESGKLIVGHNFLLDVMHIIDKFITSIPTDYEDFKDCLHCTFPNVIDTKYMASMFPFCETIKSSILENVLEAVQQDPYILPKIEIETDGQGYSLEDDKQHEAGYDAFITGVSFLGMCQYLAKLNEKSKEKFVLPGSKLLKPFLNKVFLMKIQDVPFINLTGKDEIPPRDHVLHITFPNDWKTSNLLQLFSPFSNIYIGWIDDSSAYIELGSSEQATKALSSLQTSDKYRIISYANYQRTLQPPSPPSMELVKELPVKLKKRKIVEASVKIWFFAKVVIMAVCFLCVFLFMLRISKKMCVEEVPKKKAVVKKTFEEDGTWD